MGHGSHCSQCPQQHPARLRNPRWRGIAGGATRNIAPGNDVAAGRGGLRWAGLVVLAVGAYASLLNDGAAGYGAGVALNGDGLIHQHGTRIAVSCSTLYALTA